MKRFVLLTLLLLTCGAHAQVTTQGYLNIAREELPGTLLSAPGTLLTAPGGNDTASLGRTTTINYLKGWLIVGAESPGSAPGSDLNARVFDISNPSAPVRVLPSHFNLNPADYPGNTWYQNTAGWDAHGSALSGDFLLPGPLLRVLNFGGVVERGGTNGIPNLAETPLGYNRSSQAGPWDATLRWYGGNRVGPGTSTSQEMIINRVRLNQNGVTAFQELASFDHIGPFGGGDWHPMFFGDLLIYARSGGAARDGVVVYRLQYNDFEDGLPANDTITPQFVSSLDAGFSGYWPTFFSDGSGLYVIGSSTNILTAANITAASIPGGDDTVTLAATLTIPNFTNASYPVFQDQYGFIHNRKINMTEFLAGDPEPIALTLNEMTTSPGIDTSQMSLPLGNLWITGGTNLMALTPPRSQGMAIWVHQQESDTRAPVVSYHIPQVNRTNYPRFAPLSFLIHEQPRNGGPRNGIDFTVRPVLEGDTLGSFVPGYLIHDFSGVLTFTPTSGLAAETTYQVDFLSDNSNPANPIGFFDIAGNPIEPYSFRFSTGNGVNATPPPVIESLTADDYQPAPGQLVTVTASASGEGPFDFRFNFDGTWSQWGESPTANHSYLEEGRPRVLVQVRDAHDILATRPLNLLVMETPVGPAPTQSSTLAVGNDPAGRRLWAVSPDANTVSVFDAATGAKITEHAVGENPRSIARDANGRYWVACHRSDELRVLNPDGSLHTTVTLPYGSAPFGLAPTPNGLSMFVSLYGSGQLRRYNVNTPGGLPAVRITFPTPRAIAVSGNGERVFVTRFISPELEAEIGEFHGSSANLDLVRTFRLSSANPTDGGDRASGVPNYLAGIALSPDGTRAAVVSKQDNILRGQLFGVGDLTHETTVRAVISFLDLENNTEIRHSRRDFDNSDSPSAVTYTPLGDTLLVTLQGNNRLVGLDTLSLAPVIGQNVAGSTETSPAVLTLSLPTGLAPQGVLVDPISQRLYTQDFMDRTVTLFNAEPLLTQNSTNLTHVATTDAVNNELLAENVLQGKRVFYNAADDRMSADNYISCASCHLDGGSDGRVWDFTGRGEGLRRTTDLRGRGGMNHGNVHWSGNFDEIQDFEHDIRNAFGGTGFLNLNAEQFAAQHPSPASTKAGLSTELDQLAAYLASLGTASVPRSPHRNTDGSLTEAAIRGRDLFVGQNCMACHSGNQFTDSALTAVASPLLHDVGTTSGLSGQRLGGFLAGLDTPTLQGLHATRTYLHHGQATTLDQVFSYAGGTLLLANQAQILTPGVTLTNETAFQGGGGFERGLLGGSMLEVSGAPNNGVRFNAVDGGAGGPARIAIRHILRGTGTTRLIVNGVEQLVNFLPQLPNNGWQTSGWRWLTVDATLQPGPNNVLEIRRGDGEFSDFQLNAVLVSNESDLAAAAPHRNVIQTLSTQQRDDLLAYLRQLDGSPGEAPAFVDPENPNVQITLAAGTSDPLTAPYVDFDIIFSAPISGLTASDFLLGGTAGATVTNLITVVEGTHYRLRVTGFTQAGSLTLQLPAGAVNGLAPDSTNNASSVSVLSYSPPVQDDLAALSDEFEDPTTLSQWLRNETEEGWNAGKLEQWDIDTTTPGNMRLMPYSSSWYQDFTGAYTYKMVTGDFVVTIDLDVARRNGLLGRPTSDYSLTGLMVRAPRGITAAAPQPNYASNVVLPVPPPAQGMPNHYTTDWLPGTENYIFLSFGFGNNTVNPNPNVWQYEVKTTTNGVSTLYPRTHGVPENEGNATLQIVRRGSTFLLLRRHGAGPWIVENRFERTDLPATLQVGLTTYTDWNTVAAGWNYVSTVQPYHQNRIVNVGVGNPDIVADVEYFRLRRPDPALDAADLQAVAVTGADGPVAALAGTPIEAYLGDNAVAPVDNGQNFEDWLGENLTPPQLADPNLTNPLGDAYQSGMPNVLHFLLGGAPASAPRMEAVDDGEGGSVLRYLVNRNPEARGWRLTVESSADLTSWEIVATSENGAYPTGLGVDGEIAGNPPTMVIGPGGVSEPEARRFYRLRVLPLP